MAFDVDVSGEIFVFVGVEGEGSVGLVLVGLRARFGIFGEMLSGLKRRSRRLALGPSGERVASLRGGRLEDRGAVRREGEASMSSASPRYRGRPSAPISTLGGFRK